MILNGNMTWLYVSLCALQYSIRLGMQMRRKNALQKIRIFEDLIFHYLNIFKISSNIDFLIPNFTQSSFLPPLCKEILLSKYSQSVTYSRKESCEHLSLKLQLCLSLRIIRYKIAKDDLKMIKEYFPSFHFNTLSENIFRRKSNS